MNLGQTFRRTEQVSTAVEQLARFVVGLGDEPPPPDVRERVRLMLTDLLGVTLAGARTPEMQALSQAWASPPGHIRVPGSSARTTPEVAAYLSAVAGCMLELDEGNKYAMGHPAAHVVFAAVAAAQMSDADISGERFVTAVAAGYEVAARFGRATRRDPRWHTHGHWGATGAACAAMLMLDADPDAEAVAAAIDAATGLMHVTPWQTVLSGDFTRNLWMAGANQAGLNAARLARAGLVENRGSAAHSLGDLVGTLDPGSLTSDLGRHWLTSEGYLKRHSACAYTHVAVDLVQELRRTVAWRDLDEVAGVQVRVHSLAEPLLRRHPTSRLSAMFSLPFVVSTAMVSEHVDPQSMTPGTPAFSAAEAFSARIDVTVDDRLDHYLPDRRCTEVEVTLRDGSTVALAQSNPIGDGAHFPLGADEVTAKLARLLGREDADRLVSVMQRLPSCESVVDLLATFP
jgi:2-methylcitrate dehydratase PrpD